MSKKRSCYLRYKSIFAEYKKLAKDGPYPEGPTHIFPQDGTAAYGKSGDTVLSHYGIFTL